MSMLGRLAPIGKAIAAGVGAACSYFGGLLVSDQTFADLNTSQWLMSVPFVLAVYGITWKTTNRPA